MTVDVVERRSVARRHPFPIAVALCLAVAVVSLVAPIDLSYDSWAWLVWGREIPRLALDTTSRPSWKPLPVLPTTVFSLFGGWAPDLWLVFARTVGLLALVAVYRIAARWGGWVAGLTAAVALFLTPDQESRYSRLVFEGHVEPLTVTLGLWAVERHLDGHRSQALWLGTAVALSRPEAWPFLGLYAAWLWWQRETPRWVIAAALAVIPVLWFGGDLWGSGSLSHGADVAQLAGGSDLSRFENATERAGEMVPWPVWVAAVIGLCVVVHRRQRGPLVLVALAAGWCVVVVAMCVGLRYAALGRFYLAAAALVCILAGLGVAAVVDGVRQRARWAMWCAIVLVLCLPFLWPRVHAVDIFLDESSGRAHFERGLDRAIDAAGGRDALVRCRPVAIDDTDLADTSRTALAWKLDVPLADVRSRLTQPSGVYFAQTGSPQDLQLSTAPPDTVQLLGRTSTWSVYAVGCPPVPATG